MITKSIQLFLLFTCLALSCCRTGTPADKAAATGKKETLFYYHEFNCLNFLKRCDIDIVKLINHDTLIYVSSSEYSGHYEEFYGKLKQVNDSIYYVKCFRSLRQDGMMPFKHNTTDTLAFICDSSLINNTLTIEYQNKKSGQFKIYATRNEFPVNKQYFNNSQNKVYITFDYLHPILDETVGITGMYNSDTYFTTDRNFSDFYIIINSTGIKTINLSTDISWGPKFVLKSMTKGDRLSHGRKLYGQ